MKQRFRTGGLAAWSISHPIGITMLALTTIVVGLFSLQRLGIDLLPHIIFPEIRVRILDPGVPANIMEDKITRQLEEQLAITEGAIQVQSKSTEGRSAVNLSFPYGTDIDLALRDASTRLDRAKRFLPDTIEPAVIYKRDPSQRPVLEIIASSSELNPIELRTWADYNFSKWFLNLPGVAAVEVGGGLQREIQVIANQERLAGINLGLLDVTNIIQLENKDSSGGRLRASRHGISTHTEGKFNSLDDIKNLPLWLDKDKRIENSNRLGDFADIIDSNIDQRLRIRLNKTPGVKISIQKQPKENTVAVVDAVKHRIEWMQQQGVIDKNIQLEIVGDQSVFIRHSLNNAIFAALSGACLAMIVIYIFLGSLKRTLIIGTAIPIGTLVTFIIMDLNGLTLNIMTLGGLALGMGLLIDSTIVMLENITRHQKDGETTDEYAVIAAKEVNSPIIASTGTNLAAILPFLFVGGITGLLFNELVITISSAMLSALVVSLTLVPALGSKIQDTSEDRLVFFGSQYEKLKQKYQQTIDKVLNNPKQTILIFVGIFILAVIAISFSKKTFLPSMDQGIVSVSIRGEANINLDTMDETVRVVEDILIQNENVETIFTTAGGFVFGRSEFQSSSRSSLRVQLVPVTERNISTETWITDTKKKLNALNLVGFKINLRSQGLGRAKHSSGDDDLSYRIQGNDLEVLRDLGTQVVELLQGVEGIRNVVHTYDGNLEELKVRIDRQRAADLGLRVDDLGRILRIALDGQVISKFIDGDREFDIRLRLPQSETSTPEALENIIIGFNKKQSIRVRDVATVAMGPSPTAIKRDQQQRIVEISASMKEEADLKKITVEVKERLKELNLPNGYIFYDGGANKTLKQGQQKGFYILFLAIFLVFVVMAVQYESLRNPLVIIFSIPFAAIGVAIGVYTFFIPLSMPVWLGLIMLSGIVVNNAIMLVEQIEIERSTLSDAMAAIKNAVSLRLRPILMTTLTTVFGMLPLALGLGEGSELLQPLAVVIVCGLSFSMFVSLLVVPAMYKLVHKL